ncbi:hypothetical protein AA0114_g394 [Alternaria tenuissima]|uniref:Uncharacterized protein n=1 Tax=Alternaria tenuissima TaxID=119927 RepID=A0A4V1WPQ9_9PLEO|nr:hypothetical protein AA0114_g394 [Alternaria tenuissima]
MYPCRARVFQALSSLFALCEHSSMFIEMEKDHDIYVCKAMG